MNNHSAPILVTSMLTTLMSRIRCYLQLAQKNKLLAEQLTPVFKQISEQLLPYFCVTSSDNHTQVNKVHHLIFLLAQKVKEVFHSSTIKACLDQNWSLKGLLQTLKALFKYLQVENYREPLDEIKRLIKFQNLQSAACVTAFVQQVRQSDKQIQLDDLNNLVQCYQTDLKLVQSEIEKFKNLSQPKTHLFTINPWAYDLKKFDMKLTMNNDLSDLISESLSSIASQVFWFSYFKCQSAVSTDEFFEAIREICSFSQLNNYYKSSRQHFEKISLEIDYKISLQKHASTIQEILDSVTEFRQGIDFFTTLSKFTSTVQSSVKLQLKAESSLSTSQYLQQLNEYENLKHLKLAKLNQVFSQTKLEVLQNTPSSLRLKNNYILGFEITNQDQTLSACFHGDTQIFKIGEGDQNDLQIPNDKKLWECQLMFISREGQYFVRDCGRVHPTRIQLVQDFSLKLQKNNVIDFGNCLQLVVDLITHKRKKSNQHTSQGFNQQVKSNIISVDPEKLDREVESPKDLPTLRLRTIWTKYVNQDVLIQNEFVLEATQNSSLFRVGRSAKNQIQINLKELSSEHCYIEYDENLGWILTEKYNTRPSSNGTFLFLKTYPEILEQQPSNIVKINDRMVLNFVNYQVKLNLLPKSKTDLANNSQAMYSQITQLENSQNINQTQKDILIPTRLNLESQLSSTKSKSKSNLNVFQESNIILASSSNLGSQTSDPTVNQVPLQAQNCVYRSQESPTKNQNFSQYLKNQLLDYAEKSESALTSFVAKEFNLQETLSSQKGNKRISDASSSKNKAVQMEDKIIQYPSQQELLKLVEKTFKEVQTSTNFKKVPEIIHEDIAAQTESVQQRQIDTQTSKVEVNDAQVGINNTIQEFGSQTDVEPVLQIPQKQFEEFGVQTNQVLKIDQSQACMTVQQIESSALSNFQSQMQLVEAISLQEMELETVRVQFNLETVQTIKEEQIPSNDRYQQETLQNSRVGYIFEQGKEDNKIAPESSDTE